MTYTLETRARWSYHLDCTIIEYRAVMQTASGEVRTEWTSYESIARLDAGKVLRNEKEKAA